MTSGKNERGRESSCPPIFWSLKRVLELLISVRMNPFTTFYVHWVDVITPGEKNKEKKTTNKHASVIFLLAKKLKIPNFYR